VFAGIAPGKVVANLVAGAVAEAGAQQAGDMMQARLPGCKAQRGRCDVCAWGKMDP